MAPLACVVALAGGALLAVGCSSSDGTPPLASDTGGRDGSVDARVEDGRAAVDGAADAGSDSMSAADAPVDGPSADVEAPPDAPEPEACVFADGGARLGASCDQCVGSMCCADWNACSTDEACVRLSTCIVDCGHEAGVDPDDDAGDEPSCRDACIQSLDAAAPTVARFGRAVSCLTSTCGSSCPPR